jgi:hypothetical protein
MKTRQIVVLAALLASGVALTYAETNAVRAKVHLAAKSNDVESVSRLLPEVERMWPQKPREYFELANDAARAWNLEMTNIMAQRALVGLFTNMIRKPLPEDNGDAAICVELKQALIHQCLHFDVIRKDQTRWVEIANFAGEVRARMIPNYKNRTVRRSIAGLTPEEKQAIDEAYRRDFAMDYLQLSLRSADSSLTGALQGIPLWFQGGSSNSNFLNQVISRARFSQSEASELRTNMGRK